MKAVSAVIATIMLLMVTVSMVGVSYVFSSTMAGTTTSSGEEQASQLTSQLSSCMQIENIINNQITLKNCGKGVIDNRSLAVTIGDVKLDASTKTIPEGNSSIVNVSGLWQFSGKHNLKISSGGAVAQALVDVQVNEDGLVGSWNFDEGSGIAAGDNSGYGNAGTLLPAGSEPQWISGKFGKGLQFDWDNDYAIAPNYAAQSPVRSFSFWFNADGVGNGGPSNGYSSSPLYHITASDGWWIEWRNSGSLELATKVGGDYVGFPILPPFADLVSWHHVSGTIIANSSVKVWLDGILKVNGNIGNWSDSNSQLMIGSGTTGANNQNAYNQHFNGILDEIRIWNKSFSPDETVVMKQII